MAVETLYGEFGYHTFSTQGLGGTMKCAFGRYNFSTVVVEDGDIRKVLVLPAKCLVVGGAMWAGDLDTGTETLDIDLGWADNGGGSETLVLRLEGASRAAPSSFTFTNMGAGSASATGFINSGVWSGDAVTDIIAAGINWRPIPLITGPIYFSRKTTVQFEVNAASNTPADKEAWAFLNYVVW